MDLDRDGVDDAQQGKQLIGIFAVYGLMIAGCVIAALSMAS